MTTQIILLPPFFENAGKRLIKSPKVYVADSGLACYLQGIQTDAELRRSPFRGAIFEGFVAAKIIKAQVHADGRLELCYFRDQQGLEVDFLVPRQGERLTLVEAKAGRTVRPELAAPMRRLATALISSVPGRTIDQIVVHEAPRAGASTHALAPGTKALPWQRFVESLRAGR